MKAKFINEKFIEESDPINDMNIGIPEIKEFFSKIEEFKNVNFDSLSFLKLRKNYYTLKDNIQNIILMSIINHFKDKYGLIFKKREYDYMADVKDLDGGVYLVLEINDFAPRIHFRNFDKSIWDFTDNVNDMNELDKKFIQICELNNISIPKKKGSN